MSDEELIEGSIKLYTSSENESSIKPEKIPDSNDKLEADIKSNNSYPNKVGNTKILNDRILSTLDDKYKNDSKSKVDKWVAHNELEMAFKREEESETARIRREIEELKAQIGLRGGSPRSDRPFDHRNEEIDGTDSFHNNRRPDNLRYATSPYRDAGPSNKYLGSNYGEYNRLDRMNNLEQNRPEPIRLSTIVDKPRSMGYYQESNDATGSLFHSGSTSSNQSSIPYFPPDKYRYNDNYSENRQEMGRGSFYPYKNASHLVHSHSDPFRSHPYIAEQYADSGYPSCSCYSCYKTQIYVSSPVSPHNYHKPNPFVLPSPSQSHNSRISNASQSRFRDPQSPTRRGSDVIRTRRRKVVLAKNARSFQPVLGGAPIVTCCNCFELLKVPEKVFLIAKMQCGACFTVLCCEILDKKLVVSIKEQVKEISSPEQVIKHDHDHHMDLASPNFQSDDLDNSNSDFQHMNTESILSDTRDFEFERNQHNSYGTVPKNDDLPQKLSAPPPGSSLKEHLDYSTNKLAMLNQGTMNDNNQNIPSNQDEVIQEKVTLSTTSMKDEPVVTQIEEMELLVDELTNNKVCENLGLDLKNESENGVLAEKSENAIRERVLARIKNGDASDSPRIGEGVERNVMVNGHAIPEHLIKMAEKLAGPILPGQYWYDIRAGFWGVMGRSCLGIIPPNIEEFNYPIPENCAGGNTGVYVNGRELHRRDLDLLVSRGLPPTKNRYYVVEISGRVVDEDTGEELYNLGELAPTVEKAKRGFGMKYPRASPRW